MSRWTNMARLGRTLCHLEPGQIMSRASEPVIEALDRRGAGLSAPATVPGWPSTFTPTDERVGSQHVGPTADDITLLGTKKVMGPPVSWDWDAPDAPRLWRFHLNYWDWAHEVKSRSSGKRLLEDFIGGWLARTRYGVGDEWEPYVVSLRLWNLCALHRPEEDALGGDNLVRSVAQQQYYLSRRLEWDIRGNHLIKNLKALCGAAAFLGQEARLRTELRRAHEQIARQVLSDGGHEERSPAYHSQVLQDIIDLRDLATSCGQLSEAANLEQVAVRMTEWLRTMSVAGTLPALNDGFPVSAELLALIGVEEQTEDEVIALQAESGYVRVRVGKWDHLLDVGPLGPRHNPGHGHADSLSFVAWYSEQPLLVDTGTSTYAAGKQRTYERSTRAHNTVEVDRCDSSEVWSSFRVGRRATTTLEAVQQIGDQVIVSARHDGYERTHGSEVRRIWTGQPDRLVVADLLSVRAGVTPPATTTHLHLHPDYIWSGNRASGPAGTFTIICRDERGDLVPVDASTSPVAAGFDRLAESVHLQFHWPRDVTGVTTTIRVGSASEHQRESI